MAREASVLIHGKHLLRALLHLLLCQPSAKANGNEKIWEELFTIFAYMTPQQAISILTECASESRVAILQKVLAERTRHITVCLEDLYQAQNASAVLRSCEAFGVQDVHIVERRNTFTLHKDIVMGANKWLTLHKYKPHKYENPTREAITQLRDKGYRIVATTPHEGSVSLQELDLTKGKVALFFGTERTGLSEDALQGADEFMTVPMYGFVESLNISVCAAITLQNLTQRLRTDSVAWQLNPEERDELMLLWLKKSVRHSEEILKRQLTKH